jgi:hypothetical protein
MQDCGIDVLHNLSSNSDSGPIAHHDNVLALCDRNVSQAGKTEREMEMNDIEQLLELTEKEPSTCSITFKVGENELIVDQSLDVTLHGYYESVKGLIWWFFTDVGYIGIMTDMIWDANRADSRGIHTGIRFDFNNGKEDVFHLIQAIKERGGLSFFDKGQEARNATK